MADVKGFPRLSSLMLAIEEFRKFDQQMPVQMAASFIFVAMHPGCTMAQLADALGISQSSSSRNVAALSATHSAGKSGHDLLVAEADPREWRRKIVKLTAKGQRVAATLTALLDA